MKLGISLSNNQGIEEVQDIVQLAVRAEALGFDSVWASDHVFNVSYVLERIGNRPYYDPLTILTYVAAKTERISLGTSVLVLPYHQPMRLAKAAATLDVMSGGRLLLGVGVDVIEQELNAMGSAYRERGAITDETIDILKRLWTEEEPNHQGRYYQFSGMKFSPKPMQKPHIPLLIGGVSRAAIRRAARVGKGWHPTAMPTEELRDAMEYLTEEAQAAGRSANDIPVSISISMQGGRAGRYGLGTEPIEMVEKLQAFQRLGVDTVVVSPYTGAVGNGATFGGLGP
ncbi:LLM class F420-dependent oxidoreductase [Candidatus Entotheonella serta]|nr:LLM class F420-dependent oxidoreductase [Candidatus Entotheonella serta]